MAQWIAHWTSNPEVAGSNPVKSAVEQINNFVPVAQRIRRETTNLEIAGSNPVGDKKINFYINCNCCGSMV